ncbi:hypothetical protein [Streptomyces sp. NPDC087859]|uniref:hypothetical protein n=1 Tax=Streptomyces sp. NPDC087859 TaxID=3365812 RepID=UPI0038168C88
MAILALLGRRAWSMPRWLDLMLPDLDVEGEKLDRELPAQTAERTPEPVATR